MHNVVEEAYPFKQETKDRLSGTINRLVTLYAKCITRDDLSAALRQLKVHQREHIAWERDTVWRLMISQDRHGDSDGHLRALGGHIETEENAVVAVPTPVGRVRLTGKKIFLLVAIITFITLVNIRTFPTEEASRAFAVLVFSTILWATEVCFITMLLNATMAKLGNRVGNPFVCNLYFCSFVTRLPPSFHSNK